MHQTSGFDRLEIGNARNIHSQMVIHGTDPLIESAAPGGASVIASRRSMKWDGIPHSL